MSWNDVFNHKQNLDRFRRSLNNERLASTYLFVGPEGIGKRKFAFKLAESLLCQTNDEKMLEPCGHCSSCQQVQALTHPDVIYICKPADKAFIPVETFIGDKEHRHREGLCHEIGLKPFGGRRKIAIIDDADFLNQEGANSLLKTLEEPPPHSLLILIGTGEKRQLKTIVSRSQVVRFGDLDGEEVKSILSSSEFAEQLSELATSIEALVEASEGSVKRALDLAQPGVWEFRQRLFEKLASLDPAEDFADELLEFVESVGKEAAQKRSRLVFVGDLAISFYRQLYRQTILEGEDSVAFPHVGEAVQRFDGDALANSEIAARCIERTTIIQSQVHANVGRPLAVEAWLRDLGLICRGQGLMV